MDYIVFMFALFFVPITVRVEDGQELDAIIKDKCSIYIGLDGFLVMHLVKLVRITKSCVRVKGVTAFIGTKWMFFWNI